MHWGINAWAIYAVVGLAVAYVSYRRGRVPLMSSILQPFMGAKGTDSVPARIIDGLAIIATLFGTAASLGIGALQIGRGVAARRVFLCGRPYGLLGEYAAGNHHRVHLEVAGNALCQHGAGRGHANLPVVLDHLPGAQFIAPVVIVMLAVFFITTADSASIVNSQLSQRGNPAPNKLVTIFWVICMACRISSP